MVKEIENHRRLCGLEAFSDGWTVAPSNPAQVEDTVEQTATIPPDGPQGSFFRNRKPIAWQT